jgi:hypothetical protein
MLLQGASDDVIVHLNDVSVAERAAPAQSKKAKPPAQQVCERVCMCLGDVFVWQKQQQQQEAPPPQRQQKQKVVEQVSPVLCCPNASPIVCVRLQG